MVEYEDAIKQHEDNVLKYKKERESLAKTIEEQQKELDLIHAFLEKKKTETRNTEPERIVVHVNRDGSYQKTVERITANSGSSASNTRINKKK